MHRPATFRQDIARPATPEQGNSKQEFWQDKNSPKNTKKVPNLTKNKRNNSLERGLWQDIPKIKNLNPGTNSSEMDNFNIKKPKTGHFWQDTNNPENIKTVKNTQKWSQIHQCIDNISANNDTCLNSFKINETENDFFKEHSVIFDRKALKQFCEKCT